MPLDTDDVYIRGSDSNLSITNVGAGLTSLAGLHFTHGYSGTATLANALSVGTFEMTSGTLDQPSARNLTVTSALLWSGGTLNSLTTSGAEVNVSGATGVIDPPNTGSMAIGSTLRVVSGAALTVVSGVLDFIRGSGMYIADNGKVKAFIRDSNTDVSFLNPDLIDVAPKKIDVAEGGGIFITKKNPLIVGGVIFAFPIVNNGTIGVEDGIQVDVRGRIDGDANRPSIDHHSGAFTFGSGSYLIAEHGFHVTGGTFTVVGVVENYIARIKGNVILSSGSLEYSSIATSPFARLTVEGNMTWTGGTWKPNMGRTAAPVVPGRVLPNNDSLWVTGTLTIGAGAELRPIIPNPNNTDPINSWIILRTDKGTKDNVPPLPAALNNKWEVEPNRLNGVSHTWSLRNKP